jgi:CheY-like chemotaxis protein
MPSIVKHILCVHEDDAGKMPIGQLTALGHEVTATNSLARALFTAATRRFDLIVMERGDLDRMGLDVCSKFRQMHPQTPIIFYSRPARDFAPEQLSQVGATYFVRKPDLKTLFSRVMEFV